MRAALASCLFRNGDVAHNLERAARFIRRAAEGGAELVVFGESFLQGFDALSWNWERDRWIGLPRDSAPLAELGRLSAHTGADVLMGYIERDGESLYSSAALFSGGRILRNYRRVSPGWRVVSRTDRHYREGADTGAFLYRGRLCRVALCGDLWVCPERFAPCDLLLWPVYVDFTAEEWPRELPSYALQAYGAAPRALMVNSLSRDPDSLGGAYLFSEGRIAARLPLGEEGLLFAEI